MAHLTAHQEDAIDSVNSKPKRGVSKEPMELHNTGKSLKNWLGRSLSA